MAIEQTLSIIKPDGVKKNVMGKIIARFEEEGLRPVAMRMVHMSQADAEGFYAVHKDRGFFKDLCKFMTSGPCLVMALQGENAIAKNREIMGATNPANAAPNTLRKLFASGVEENTVHGSDAPETAKQEIAYWFRSTEVVSR